jgi:FtsZ-interacting cell division protein ZipA
LYRSFFFSLFLSLSFKKYFLERTRRSANRAKEAKEQWEEWKVEKEKERVSKQKKVLQLKEHVARKKEMKKEINQMAYVAWQKNKKIKAVAQKKQKIQDELKRAQEEAAVEVLIRHKKEQKKKARLKQQQLLDKQLLLSMNDFAVSQEKHAMDNVEKKKIKTMKKKLTALLKTPYTDKMTKSLLRGKTPNGVHTRDTMAPQWLMTSTFWGGVELRVLHC